MKALFSLLVTVGLVTPLLAQTPAVRLGSMQFLSGDWTHTIGFSPDGKWLFTAGQEPFARLWNIADGREVRRFPAESSVMRAVLSPDGTLAAGCDNSCNVLLWEVATGQVKRTLHRFKQRGFPIVFAPDGSWVAAGGDEPVVIIWEVASGKQLQRLEGHEQAIRALAVSPDGKRLVTAGGDQTLRVWDRETGKELYRLEGGSGFHPALAWSPGGEFIAGSSENRIDARSTRSSMRIWDAKTGKVQHDVPGSFNAVAFAPDGKTLATGGLSDLRIIDTATGKTLRNGGRMNVHWHARCDDLS